NLADQASQHYNDRVESKWLDRLEANHDNIRAALEWSLAENESEVGLLLAATLGLFWRKRFYKKEGQIWLERFLATSKPPSSARAKALTFLGLLTCDLGDIVQAQALTAQALAIARNLADQSCIAWALSIQGHIEIILHGGRQSAVLLEESVALF